MRYFYFSPWPGACSSALQGAVGKARWAAEEGGRAPARGNQSLSLVVVWAGRVPHALHHSSADLCLTKRHRCSCCRSWILPRILKGPLRQIWWYTIFVHYHLKSDYCICTSHRSCRVHLCQTALLQPYCTPRMRGRITRVLFTVGYIDLPSVSIFEVH